MKIFTKTICWQDQIFGLTNSGEIWRIWWDYRPDFPFRDQLTSNQIKHEYCEVVKLLRKD